MMVSASPVLASKNSCCSMEPLPSVSKTGQIASMNSIVVSIILGERLSVLISALQTSPFSRVPDRSSSKWWNHPLRLLLISGGSSRQALGVRGQKNSFIWGLTHRVLPQQQLHPRRLLSRRRSGPAPPSAHSPPKSRSRPYP